MEIFGKTCDEFIGGCYETNSEHCLPDDEHHTTHEWKQSSLKKHITDEQIKSNKIPKEKQSKPRKKTNFKF